jgi:arylsulfatase A-like enzyme
VRIPLIARVPWLEEHRSVMEEPVSLIDLYPTILELLGIDRSGVVVQGRSLAKAIETGQPLGPRHIMTRTLRGKPDPQARHGIRWTSLLGGDLVKLHRLEPPRQAPRYMRFDLNRDPAERDGSPGEDQASTQALARELARQQHRHLELREQLDLARPAGLGPQLLETLRGLGYVE